MLCRGIIQKIEGEDTITREYISQTPTMTCSTHKNINNSLVEMIGNMGKNWANLHATPSGYKLLEVTSITLITAYIPDIRGGCGKFLNTKHKSGVTRGLFPIINEDSEEENQMCFKDAILFGGMFFMYIIRT
jgi:hypothetical protein